MAPHFDEFDVLTPSDATGFGTGSYLPTYVFSVVKKLVWGPLFSGFIAFLLKSFLNFLLGGPVSYPPHPRYVTIKNNIQVFINVLI